jgi:hypothetical protein
MSTAGYAELDAMIERVKSLGELPETIAAAAAPLVEDAVRKTASAGTTPDGEAWAPRKADGSPALRNAAQAVHASARGTLVVLELGATSTGSAKVQAIQNAQRPILPRSGSDLPATVLGAVQKAATSSWSKAMGGPR